MRTAAALEAWFPPTSWAGPGRQRYSQLLYDAGGIIDDLMVTCSVSPDDDGRLFLVVNASRKEVDYAHISSRLPAAVMLLPAPERALVALQGPAAKTVMAQLSPAAAGLAFMAAASGRVGGFDCHVSRSGYTGEDGFEFHSCSRRAGAGGLLLAQDGVQPIGLGARDSLRLEAALPLRPRHRRTTSPIEAGLAWSIQKRRRSEGGFPGAKRIQDELTHGPKRRRVGIRPDGRAPAREGTEVLSPSGERIGVVTSGGFGPSVNGPVAMGYVEPDQAKVGTPVNLTVRGKALSAAVAPLPFVPHRYARSGVSDPLGQTR
jgi:aminomethyltransferase